MSEMLGAKQKLSSLMCTADINKKSHLFL